MDFALREPSFIRRRAGLWIHLGDIERTQSKSHVGKLENHIPIWGVYRSL
jgi:hypothetical protein